MVKVRKKNEKRQRSGPDYAKRDQIKDFLSIIYHYFIKEKYVEKVSKFWFAI